MQALAETSRALSPTGLAGRGELSCLVSPLVSCVDEHLAHELGRATVLATGSAAATGRIAVAALDLAPGDEVIIAPGTGRNLVGALLEAGARPVYADVDPLHGCLTAGSVADALSPHTRAVLVHHAYGAAAPVDSIAKLARRHGVRVVEDETGASPLSGPAGARRSDLGFAILPAGPGTGLGPIASPIAGLLTTDDARVARRLHRLRERHRATPAPTAAEVSALRGHLRTLAAGIAGQRDAARAFAQALGPLAGLALPAQPNHAYALTALPLLIDPHLVGVGNRTYAAALADAGVSVLTSPYEQPLYRVPSRPRTALRHLALQHAASYGPGHCPIAEDRIGRTLVLLDWGAAGPSDVAATAAAVADVHHHFLRRHADRTRG